MLGENEAGELGDGSTSSSLVPQTVSFGQNGSARFVDGYEKHTCAILTNNSLYCWGKGENGRLGNGNLNDHNIKTPLFVDFGTGKNVSKLAVGGRHTCAILNDNTTKCWGYNSDGQLGVGNRTDIATPVSVSFGSNKYATDIFAGKFHTCAILNDNSTKCWGANTFGRLGLGTQQGESFYTTPQSVTGLGSQRPLDMGLGTYHTCSVLANNTPMCWGYNNFGELGIGSTTVNSGLSTPQYVLKRTDMEFQTILASAFGSCAISTKEELLCWGRSVTGELGRGNYQDSSVPVYSHLTTPHAVEYQNIEFNLASDEWNNFDLANMSISIELASGFSQGNLSKMNVIGKPVNTTKTQWNITLNNSTQLEWCL